MAALSAMAGFGLSGCNLTDDDDDSVASRVANIDQQATVSLGFQSIDGAKLDAVVVPAGYVARILAPWGTYLTCEENWPGYFSDTGTQSAAYWYFFKCNALRLGHDYRCFLSNAD
ncbi:DUF839 domain-containing protein [Leucothrix arctica]|uniref:Uncharacterized protein n=1 Tax=Leucothrix arctica TaxID=1481894 RepID=A0A317CH64_9GAMM|nr:DUF839 domain-containing protein [Leucothrix arctica]PWQ97894.1 hypothetical protein DKT75_05360 [Leucothrix arctica]